jgi:hypothetical protein
MTSKVPGDVDVFNSSSTQSFDLPTVDWTNGAGTGLESSVAGAAAAPSRTSRKTSGPTSDEQAAAKRSTLTTQGEEESEAEDHSEYDTKRPSSSSGPAWNSSHIKPPPSAPKTALEKTATFYVFDSSEFSSFHADNSEPFEAAPPHVPSAPTTSSLRRPTMANGGAMPPAASRKSSGGPGVQRLTKPVTTRQQRQKSVGSAVLVSGASLARQHRQRSVGAVPVANAKVVSLASKQSSESLSEDDNQSGDFSVGRAPKIRNPRLANKRQQSICKTPTEAHPSPTTSTTTQPETVAANEPAENKSSRTGALSLFQRHRPKGNDEGSSNNNSPYSISEGTKPAGVLGTLFKNLSTSTETRTPLMGNEDELSTAKSPARTNRMNPRNFFSRNKHATMHSDDASVSGSVSESCADSVDDASGKPMSAEGTVLALIRAKQKAALDMDHSSIPSFLDDESSDLFSTRGGSSLGASKNSVRMTQDEKGTLSPKVNSAEDKVLAMIKAKQQLGNKTDSSLRDELIEEDDGDDHDDHEPDNPPQSNVTSAESKVLAMIQAKQQGTTRTDTALRSELLEGSDSDSSRGQSSTDSGPQAPRLDTGGNSQPSRPGGAESKVLALIRAKEKEVNAEQSRRSSGASSNLRR